VKLYKKNVAADHRSMGTTPFIHVPRSTDGGSPPERKTITIHWKSITFLLVPSLFALGNLIEGNFEKWRGYEVGATKYSKARNSGRAVIEEALKGARWQGAARYDALIADARNQAQTEVTNGRNEGDTNVHQGHSAAAIKESLAHGMILALFGRIPDIVRMIQQKEELEFAAKYGRYLVVDPTTGEFSVHETVATASSPGEMQMRFLSFARSVNAQINDAVELSAYEGARELATAAGSLNCPTELRHQ
jgi:hypothetical protein